MPKKMKVDARGPKLPLPGSASRLSEVDGLSAVFDSLATPIAALDHNGTLLYINTSWEKLFKTEAVYGKGFKAGENYLKRCEQSRGEGSDQLRKAGEGIRRILDGELRQFEFEYALKTDREPQWFRLIATPLKNNTVQGAVIMHVNVTEHRRAELLMEEFSNLGQKLSSASTAREAAGIILEVADHIWGWDCGYLHLYSEETNLLHPILTIDIMDGKKVEVPSAYLTNPYPSPRVAEVIARGAQLILRKPNKMRPDGLLPFGDKNRLSASLMVVPVRNGRKVTGVLSIDSYSFNAYTADDLSTLQSLADHCGSALERIWAQEALRESEDRLRALATRLQSAREEEGIRIAREIHDELGQTMTGLKMDLLWLAKKFNLAAGPASKPLMDKIKDMAQLTDQTIRTVRRICAELRPGVLDDLGLFPAIEWQTREFENRSGVKCELSLPEKSVVLDKERATALFRIFQEILTNVARHAKATRLRINVAQKGGSLFLHVRDNGIGISDNEMTGKKSLGLLGMRERALLFKGEVKIERARPKGTLVTVRIPLPERT